MALYRGESALGTWLFRLAMNQCLDYCAASARAWRMLTDTIEDVRAHGNAQARCSACWTGWNWNVRSAQLPGGCRAVFVLHDMEGCEHREVARAVGHQRGHVEIAIAQGANAIAGDLTAGRSGAARRGLNYDGLSRHRVATQPARGRTTGGRGGASHSCEGTGRVQPAEPAQELERLKPGAHRSVPSRHPITCGSKSPGQMRLQDHAPAPPPGARRPRAPR